MSVNYSEKDRVMAGRPVSHFFAYVARLRWIKRWGLMRNAIEENVATHPTYRRVPIPSQVWGECGTGR